MGNQDQVTDDDQDQVTDDDQGQVTDDDSDQELKHALKTLGVIRVGGKWQRQKERASSTDSSTDSSSGESDGEGGDIDAKMEALRQGSQKVVILVFSLPIKYSHFSKFYKKMDPFYKKFRCDKFCNRSMSTRGLLPSKK